jgi:hypothetical protein
MAPYWDSASFCEAANRKPRLQQIESSYHNARFIRFLLTGSSPERMFALDPHVA